MRPATPPHLVAASKTASASSTESKPATKITADKATAEPALTPAVKTAAGFAKAAINEAGPSEGGVAGRKSRRERDSREASREASRDASRETSSVGAGGASAPASEPARAPPRPRPPRPKSAGKNGRRTKPPKDLWKEVTARLSANPPAGHAAGAGARAVRSATAKRTTGPRPTTPAKKFGLVEVVGAAGGRPATAGGPGRLGFANQLRSHLAAAKQDTLDEEPDEVLWRRSPEGEIFEAEELRVQEKEVLKDELKHEVLSVGFRDTAECRPTTPSCASAAGSPLKATRALRPSSAGRHRQAPSRPHTASSVASSVASSGAPAAAPAAAPAGSSPAAAVPCAPSISSSCSSGGAAPSLAEPTVQHMVQQQQQQQQQAPLQSALKRTAQPSSGPGAPSGLAKRR